MKIPKTCKKLNSKINNDYPQGCECTFVSCKNGWGLKLFGSKHTRDYGFENQKKLNKVNLAPKVGKTFILEIPKKDADYLYFKKSKCGKNAIIYGYITQEARIVDNPTKKDRRKMSTLLSKLEKIGYDFKDWGFHNAGYIKNNLVVIDCNPLSFSNNYDYSFSGEENEN